MQRVVASLIACYARGAMTFPDIRRVGAAGALAFSIGVAMLPAARGADSLGSVTVEAQRDREKLKKGIEKFVRTAVIRPRTDDSLLRWDHAVCPLVAGLDRDAGEFFLQRFSDNARAAKVPLAPPDCKPDLFIIVTSEPARFLTLWWKRSPRLFNTHFGIAPVKRFIEVDRPVRVWYNAVLSNADGGPLIGGILDGSAASGMTDLPTNQIPNSLGSRIRLPVVRNTQSAILVIDAKAVRALNIGQLVDYVTMLALLELDLDKNLGEVPSILTLFRNPASPPAEMTPWDKALLKALYTTPQGTRVQLSQMETAMLGELTGR